MISTEDLFYSFLHLVAITLKILSQYAEVAGNERIKMF